MAKNIDFDAKTLTANFDLLDVETSQKNRILVSYSDASTVHLCTDTELDIKIVDDLQLKWGRKVSLIKVEQRPEFEEALVFFYTRSGTHDFYKWEIDCDDQYKRKCPLNWFQLTKSENPLVRDCSVCNRQVHLADSLEQARSLAQEGWCTALVSWNSDRTYDLGDLEIDEADEKLWEI